MEEDFTKAQDALYDALMNTPCKDPMDAVMALCCVMCDILVQIKMDDDHQVCNAVLVTLNSAREAYKLHEVH
jgi:hypothetical protein